MRRERRNEQTRGAFLRSIHETRPPYQCQSTSADRSIAKEKLTRTHNFLDFRTWATYAADPGGRAAGWPNASRLVLNSTGWEARFVRFLLPMSGEASDRL